MIFFFLSLVSNLLMPWKEYTIIIFTCTVNIYFISLKNHPHYIFGWREHFIHFKGFDTLYQVIIQIQKLKILGEVYNRNNTKLTHITFAIILETIWVLLDTIGDWWASFFSSIYSLFLPLHIIYSLSFCLFFWYSIPPSIEVGTNSTVTGEKVLRHDHDDRNKVHRRGDWWKSPAPRVSLFIYLLS